MHTHTYLIAIKWMPGERFLFLFYSTVSPSLPFFIIIVQFITFYDMHTHSPSIRIAILLCQFIWTNYSYYTISKCPYELFSLSYFPIAHACIYIFVISMKHFHWPHASAHTNPYLFYKKKWLFVYAFIYTHMQMTRPKFTNETQHNIRSTSNT